MLKQCNTKAFWEGNCDRFGRIVCAFLMEIGLDECGDERVFEINLHDFFFI